MFDIDIDFADRTKILDVVKHIKASRIDQNKLLVHNTGVYLQSIPHDSINNLSTIEYKQAESRGYFKIDFLNVSVYKDIRNEEHLINLMNQEPLWDLLLEDDFTNNLFHVNGHGAVLKEMKPASIEQLAAVLAMIRPAKKHLRGKDWPEVMIEIWTKPENEEYYFKKSHAHAYAVAIVVQMNLICESISAADV
jgi:DNA polymerase III alpha subunit